MTAPRRFLDVWIVESNTVYREVPFTVVVDWIQQGRLLEDDMLRPSGTAEWMKIGSSPMFSPYLPKAMPQVVEDQAEALEPIALDFAWKKRHDDEDDDVDMIPLIDVSLVLLIFFMMTTTGAAASVLIQTPPTENSELAESTNAFWIGININPPTNMIPSYSLGRGSNTIKKSMTKDQCVAELERQLAEETQPVEVTIHAHELLPAREVRALTVELEDARFRGKIRHKYTGVREK